MAKFFTRERFGTPQFAAAALLLVFLAQCVWLVHVEPIRTSEIDIVQRGVAQLRHGEINVQDPYRSPLFYLIAASPVAATHSDFGPRTSDWLRWPLRAPWIIFGVLLGASLWYVARRLYGNAGGYIALALYCFSPLIVAESASYFVQPEIGAAWGAFGAIFTSIAVAHTLYAPRRVLWNWRRIALLSLSLALAIGSQFSLWILLPIELVFLFYLAPGQRRAALAIFGASCAGAFLILWAAYSFSFSAFVAGMHAAHFIDFTPQALLMRVAYSRLLTVLVRTSPALPIFVLGALITFFAWRRARYFGNAAPLIISALFVLLGMMNPHQPGYGFELVAMPILFVFISGVIADLLETRHRKLVLGVVLVLILLHGAWSVSSLTRITGP